jgi:hypothetical protein
MTAANAAMSYNLANAVTGAFTKLNFDYSKVMISMGSLAALNGVSAF